MDKNGRREGKEEPVEGRGRMTEAIKRYKMKGERFLDNGVRAVGVQSERRGYKRGG